MKTKQEIVDELKNKINDIENGSMIPFMSFEQGAYSAHNKDLKLIEQLAEPLKVKVPAFVAEWIEWCRNYKWALSNVIDASNIQYFEDHNEPTGLTSWFVKKGHDEIIARAWLDGYEVEEEPKYYVKEPITGQFLVRDEAQSNGVKWVDGFSTHPSYYTEAEIEAIEPSYLLFKVPVEKVEVRE